MKTLKQLREEYDSQTLPQGAPEDLVLEDLSGSKHKQLGDYSKTKKTLSDIPSSITMPNLLMFRRVTYRKYPGNQTVALYYSKMVDKYLSIPFGPTGNLNLSEATVYDTIEELDLYEGAKWEAVKGGLKGAAHGAVRGLAKGNAIAAEPGAVVGALVGAVHGAYKGVKKANMEEDWQDVNRKDKTDGLSQKAVNAYRRENPGSKLKTAVTEKNPTGKRASRRKSFCSRMGGMKKRLTSAKNARDPDSPINKALRRWNCEEDFKLKLAEKRVDEGAWDAVTGAYKGFKVGGLPGAVVGGYLGWKKGDDDTEKKNTSSNSSSDSDSLGKKLPSDARKAQVKVRSPSLSKGGESAIERSRYSTLARRDYEASGKKQVAENKISDLRKMIDENAKVLNMEINGRSIHINTSMAKRILEVYDSVNTKNKKIVESMLNEDLESFKKLLNFSIKA